MKNDFLSTYLKWRKKPYLWTRNGKQYASVVFTWQIQNVPKDTIIGGPAAKILGINNDDIEGMVIYHNQGACFTTRGCIRNCPFCAVPQLEGNFRELKPLLVRPTVCDSNFLASSRTHFNWVVDRLKRWETVDFNQGLDARLMTSYHAQRLTELKLKIVRLSWDFTPIHPFKAVELLRNVGFPKSKIGIYVLIGFQDTPEDALFRLEEVRRHGHIPFPMRYQPIDTPKRNSYVAPNWTNKELIRYMKYWARLRYTNSIPFAEFQLELCK